MIQKRKPLIFFQYFITFFLYIKISWQNLDVQVASRSVFIAQPDREQSERKCYAAIEYRNVNLRIYCLLIFVTSLHVGLGRVADHGVYGCLQVFGEDGGDQSGGAHPVVHVGVHLLRLQLQAWQFVPAQGSLMFLCTGDQHYIPYKLLLIS